ncbi:MAG: addiction module protein [Bacteroidetes bacterium]|nr:MAG: addiction module protein [Bacteroidota bacterium]
MANLAKWTVYEVPSKIEVETRKILKSLPAAHRKLAELKGVAAGIPNQSILINTLGLQEAKDSSAIENIITTHDDLYKSELQLATIPSLEAKEVRNYIAALKRGYDLVSQSGMLTTRTILEIQQILENNKAGYRKLPGTSLKNAATGEIVYTPPQDYDTIVQLMAELERLINDPEFSQYDPLVKMAIIHHQFESIHPFYDGNGRTGRIINILYLIISDLLNLPILYLSKYIIKNKADYYKYLQEVRETNNWENWILFVIEGVRLTSIDTIELINEVRKQMQDMKNLLRSNYKFYSQDLLNSLFKHPYTKIGFVMDDLQVSRITAANYLNQLTRDGVLRKERIGTNNYYINSKLFAILAR